MTEFSVDVNDNVVQSSRPGAPIPIPPPLRHQLEVDFKTDLSDVRIHSGHNAGTLGALAFTDGNNIHFQPGFNLYGTPGADNMVRHELAHVVQQRQVGQIRAPHYTFRPGSPRGTSNP